MFSSDKYRDGLKPCRPMYKIHFIFNGKVSCNTPRQGYEWNVTEDVGKVTCRNCIKNRIFKDHVYEKSLRDVGATR